MNGVPRDHRDTTHDYVPVQVSQEHVTPYHQYDDRNSTTVGGNEIHLTETFFRAAVTE